MGYSKQQDYLVRRLASELAVILVEEHGKTVEQALDIVFRSKTFEKICDVGNGLYRESAGYNYDFLRDELTHGAFGQYGKYD
jgi:hypothetical protein